MKRKNNKVFVSREFKKFYGFNLKPNFIYGWNQYGQPIASSSATAGGNIFLYTLKNGRKWEGDWFDLDLCPGIETMLSSIKDGEIDQDWDYFRNGVEFAELRKEKPVIFFTEEDYRIASLFRGWNLI